MTKIINKIENNSLKLSFWFMILLIVVSFFPMTIVVQKKLFAEIGVRIIILIISTILISLRIIRNKKLFNKNELLYLSFCLVAIISATINYSGLKIDLVQPIFMFYLFYSISSFFETVSISQKEIKKIFYVIITLSIVHFVYWIVSENISREITNIIASDNMKSQYAIYGLLDTTNTYAYQIIIGVSALTTIFLFKFLKNPKVNFYSISIIFIISLMFLSVLISKSRGALFGIGMYFIILFCFGLFNKNFRNLLSKYSIVAIILVIVMIVIVISTDMLNVILTKFKNNGSTYRFLMWENFIKLRISGAFSLDFWFGEGFHGFKSTSLNLTPYAVTHLHNVFLEIWARFGLISFVLWFVFLFRNILRNYLNKDLWYFFPLVLMFLLKECFETTIFVGTFRWEMVVFFVYLLLPQYIQDADLLSN